MKKFFFFFFLAFVFTLNLNAQTKVFNCDDRGNKNSKPSLIISGNMSENELIAILSLSIIF